MAEQAPPASVNKILSATQGTLGRLVLFGVFLWSLAFGALVHLNLPVSKRAAAQLVMGLVNDSIRGTITVGAFTQLGKDGVTLENVEVFDPHHRPTLKLKSLSAEVHVLTILERVFSDNEKLSLEIQRVTARGCEVLLHTTRDTDASGSPLTHASIADAFEPIEKSEKKTNSSKRPVRVWFPRVILKRVYARGSIAGSPTVEARVPGARAQILVTNKGASIDIQRFRMRASGVGGVDTSAHGEVHIRAPGPVWGNVSGQVGDVPLHQKFRFEQGKIDIEGSFPELRPEALRPLFGTWPLDQTIAVQNHIYGKPPLLDAKIAITPQSAAPDLEPTTVSGKLQIAPQFKAQFDVVTHKLNAADLFSQAPVTALDSESKVKLWLDEGTPSLTVETKLKEGSLAGHDTPAVNVIAEVSKDSLSVDGQFQERGMNGQVHLSRQNEERANYTLEVTELRIEENERLAALLPGTRGLVQGKIKGQLDESSFTSRAELSVGGFQQGSISFSHGTLEAQLNGTLGALEKTESELKLALSTAKLGPAKLKSGTLNATGPLLSPYVTLHARTEDGLDLHAASYVGIQGRELREFEADISGKGKPVEMKASRVSYANSRIALNELLLKSIGEVKGDIDFGPMGGTIDIEAEGLSISRIASSLGLPRSEYGGDLNADIDLDVGKLSNGTFDVTMTEGALYGIDNVSLEAHGTIDGNKTRGNINGTVDQLGTVESSWEATLAGPLLESESTQRATGNLRAHLRNFDLQGFSLLLGKAIGLPPIKGNIDALLELQRSSSEEFPVGEVQFSTNELVVATGPAEDDLTIRGLDLEGGLSFAPDDDRLEAVVRLNDGRRTLASVSGALELPLNRWGAELPKNEDFVAFVRQAPVDAVIVAPERSIRQWPPYVPVPFESGNVSVRASIKGSLDEPDVGLVVTARNLEGGTSPFSRPVSLYVNSQYFSGSGAFRGSTNLEFDGQRVGTAQTDLVIPVEHFASAPRGKVPLWTGNVLVQLDNAPLQLLTELQDRGVRGTAQGAFSIDRQGWEPELDSELRLRNLAFGGHRLGDAVLQARTVSDVLIANANFTDEYGKLNVEAQGGIAPTRPFLKLATNRPVSVNLTSDDYDAAVALPFVSEFFDELRGSLRGGLKAVWLPPAAPDGVWQAKLSGDMTMTDGTLTPSALGLRLEDAAFKVTAGQEGEYNVIAMKEITARAESETTNFHADAKLFFDNLNLQGGMFYVSPENLPLKSAGEELAKLTGTAQGRFDLTDDTMKVEVSMNNLLAELPESTDSDLFELEENPDIEILQFASPEKEAPEETNSSTPIDVKFRLGNNVRVKSDIMDIKLRGTPQMRLAEQLQFGGGIELIPGGRFVVLGRGFNVERGTVAFDTGEPTNPHLSVVASWKAPNDVLIRATVTGTAKEPILEWSSVPALPGGEAEVIALVLGGGGGSTDQGAAGFSSGIAYAANEAIGSTGLKGIEFYTTQESTAGEGRMASLNDTTWDNYTASFQINDELWFEGSVQSGTGTGPSAETRRGVSGTLDWRFHPQWSARTEIGTLGTGLDLVWRYRY